MASWKEQNHGDGEKAGVGGVGCWVRGAGEGGLGGAEDFQGVGLLCGDMSSHICPKPLTGNTKSDPNVPYGLWVMTVMSSTVANVLSAGGFASGGGCACGSPGYVGRLRAFPSILL